jgi:hypothetical protein
MVAARLNKDRSFVAVDKALVGCVADKLKSVSLADLFVKSQFYTMPVEWCKEKFRRPYPPSSVVFGGDCWRRYDEYNERGIDDAR